MKKKTIYYWASNEFSNNGEGILANNFLDLIKKNFQSYNLRPVNNFKNINQKTFFYKYILPFWGVLSLWKYYVLGNKISYINFLPVWNFLLILLLPPSTILGPITGSKNRLKYNIIVKILSSIGVMILKIKFNKLLFSHNFYSSYFKKNKKKYFFNFLLYGFKVSKSSFKKEYDLVFYINKHKNKKNKFLIELIIELSKKYKICVIGEKISKTKNVTNIGYVARKKALEMINKSKASVSTYENLFSFYLLDCLKYKLVIFYNKEFEPKSSINSKLLIPINFHNPKSAINTIEKNINKRISRKISYKEQYFKNYLKIN